MPPGRIKIIQLKYPVCSPTILIFASASSSSRVVGCHSLSPLAPMAPACVLSRAPQSFAIPLCDSASLGSVTEYVKPLQQLEPIARHLVASSYGGTQQIVGAAIVEEPMLAETVWWLVFTRGSGTKVSNVKQWLRGRLPPDCSLDADRLQTLTPMMHRRLGWGSLQSS